MAEKTSTRKKADTTKFSAEEREAMKQRAAELKAAKKGAAAEADVLAKIAEMPENDRTIAEKFHALVKEVVPDVQCKTWYGFPTYHKGEGNVVFYQPAAKFGTRYGTFGFDEGANLDDGDFWASSFAVTKWSANVAKQLRPLVEKAFS